MKVDRACGRCSKVQTVEVDLKGAQELINADQKKKEALIALDDFVSKLNVDVNPEVIIITKNATGYEVEILDNLCVNPNNSKRARGCAPRVKGLIDDIFNRGKKPVKKDKGKE